ncbi:MAG: RluA family pseudouridine synthase, partial [candidate division Zixibacteria bacterium]|nr:RluA family pseudouridine synthase [candidate division Zixibacteria bacterium]
GVRVDRYLTDKLADVSRAQVQRAVDAGGVLVDGVAVKSRHKVHAGEEIEITLIRPVSDAEPPAAEDIPLDVIHEDDAIIVINKSAGMVVHPAVGNRTGTLVNALLGRGLISNTADTGDRPGIVHRLDKGTSGLIVCAKTESAHRKLADQLRDRSLSRAYFAVTWGHLKQDRVTFSDPIGRSNSDRKKMAVTERGRDAVTHARILERYELAEFLEVRLETGRTHQIRVHLSHAGHPVIGDSDYGGGAARLKGIDPAKRLLGQKMVKSIGRPALHATRLELVHPETGQRQEFEAPPPPDFRSLLDLCQTSH